MISAQEENELIDQILGGNEDSYAKLVNTYKSFAYTIAIRVLNDKFEAEEAAQDAFIKVYRNLKSFNRRSRFATWLYRIVFNTAVGFRRKRKLSTETIEHHDRGSEHADSLERSDKEVFIGKAMEQLNEADRLAIQLYYIREFSLEEVAEMTGQRVNTLKVRVHRARQRLADELTRILKAEALTL